MKYRTRIYYTEEQKALMWDRWQAGDSLHEIARLFNRHHSSVRGVFERCGGIRLAQKRGGMMWIERGRTKLVGPGTCVNLGSTPISELKRL